MIGDASLRAAAKLWYLWRYDRTRAVPSPRDDQRVRSGGSDADRVLLVGNGPAHGWGTVTHELALTGQLARAFTRRTGRPTDIEYVGDELMNLKAVIPWIGPRPLADLDLVLLVLSMNDALRLTPLDEYVRDMETLLDKLARETKSTARIVVAGISPVRAFPSYQGLFAALGQRNADRLNAAVRSLVGRYDGVEFMDLDAPEAEPGRPYGSPGMYAAWSEMFAGVCGTALDTTRALEGERAASEPEPERVWDWEPAKQIMDLAASTGIDALDELVAEARREFGVDLAFVSLVDGGRQFVAATTSTAPAGGVPLELTHCRVTMQGSEPLVVQNSFKDDRFKDSPWIDMTRMSFYAGMPLTDGDGNNVGTFCVMSTLPTSAHRVSEMELRAYAARAQEQLDRLAEQPRTAPVAHVIPGGADRAELHPHGVDDQV